MIWNLHSPKIQWIGKVRVTSCELRVASCELRVASCSCFASCELRVSSEKCELVHLKRELRVPKKNFKFSSFAAKKLRFFGQPF